MEDDIHAAEDLANAVGITDVADDKLDLGGKIGRRTVGVDLRGEVIEDADLVASREEAIGEVGADETCSAGDEDLLRLCGGSGHRAMVSSGCASCKRSACGVG